MWRARLERYRPWVWPYGALAVALAAAMWPVWTSATGVVGYDMLLQHYPLQVLARDMLGAGELPLWNPYTLSGQPAFAHPYAVYLYPTRWLLFWLPAEVALNWSVAFHVLLAGIGAAWCARRLGAGADGQFVSGIAYALGSGIVQRLWPGHLTWIETNAWLPLATGCALNIPRRWAIAGLGLVVACVCLDARPEMLVLMGWWTAVWAAIAAWSEGLRRVATAAAGVAAAFVLGLGLSAVQLVPTAAMLLSSTRQEGALSVDFLAQASLPPWHLLEALAPSLFGDPVTHTYWPSDQQDWHERLLYVGVVPLFLAFRASGRWRWPLFAMACLTIALSFGRFLPAYPLLQALLPFEPGYGTFRVPPRHLVLAALALSLAAGLGMHRLQGFRFGIVGLAAAAMTALASPSFGTWFPAVAALLGGTEGITVPDSRHLAEAAAPAMRALSWLLLLTGATAFLPGRWAGRGQIVLAMLDLWILFAPYRANLLYPQPIIDFAAQLQGHPHSSMIGFRGAEVGQFAPLLRVTQPTGYDSTVSGGYAGLLLGPGRPDATVFYFDRADDPALPLLGVNTIWEPGRPPYPAPHPAKPPAWVARCARPGEVGAVRSPGFSWDACITIAGTAQQDPVMPPEPAAITGLGTGWLAAQASGPGWLVTTFPLYPGWSAALDGRAAPVEAADGALVAVRLPEGWHTIEIAYRPAGAGIGLAVSALTAAAVIAWSRFRPRLGQKAGGPSVNRR